MRRPPAPVVAVLAGLLLAAATPPWGWWVLAPIGIAVADHALHGTPDPPRSLGGRFRVAWLVWAGLLFPTLFWMRSFTLPGYLIASALYAAFLAAGTVVAPRGPGRFVALPAGIMLAEWIRWRWPFGGVPLSNLAVAQVGGPLAPLLRVGGALLVVGATVTFGLVLAALWKGRPRIAGGLAAVLLVLIVLSLVAPAGRRTGTTLDVAVVQGGGPQGTRAADTDPGVVFERHLAASEGLEPGELDLVVWPEDVVDVVSLPGTPEEAELQALARRVDATFVAGVIEDEGDDRFRNWAIAYGPDGDEVGRYEKVERVPFGEWVPFRGFLEGIAGDALPPRDARIGETPAVIDTPAGRLGVVISWEVFFGERARDAIGHGGQVLLNPTNGASYHGTQVQTQQVASSRMRAIETGRWVLQAAPTGFSAVITPDGRVLQRTAVSERAVLLDTVDLREGETLYVRFGDLAAILYAIGCLAAGWAIERRSLRAQDAPATAPAAPSSVRR